MGLLRLLIFSLLAYLLYRLLFPRARLRNTTRSSSASSSSSQVSDVLVEDPVCHTYVPKRASLARRVGDETLYFCSDKCYEAYLLQKGAEK